MGRCLYIHLTDTYIYSIIQYYIHTHILLVHTYMHIYISTGGIPFWGRLHVEGDAHSHNVTDTICNALLFWKSTSCAPPPIPLQYIRKGHVSAVPAVFGKVMGSPTPPHSVALGCKVRERCERQTPRPRRRLGEKGCELSERRTRDEPKAACRTVADCCEGVSELRP